MHETLAKIKNSIKISCLFFPLNHRVLPTNKFGSPSQTGMWRPTCFFRNIQWEYAFSSTLSILTHISLVTEAHTHIQFMINFSIYFLLRNHLYLNLALVLSCSVMSDSVIWWTVAYQALLSMEFSRQEYWSENEYTTQSNL